MAFHFHSNVIRFKAAYFSPLGRRNSSSIAEDIIVLESSYYTLIASENSNDPSKRDVYSPVLVGKLSEGCRHLVCDSLWIIHRPMHWIWVYLSPKQRTIFVNDPFCGREHPQVAAVLADW